MNIEEIRALLSGARLSARMVGDRLSISGPHGSLTDASIVSAIANHKSKIVSHLRSGNLLEYDVGPCSTEAPPNEIPSECAEIEPEHLTLINLAKQDIDQIVGTVDGGVSNVQDIYPLAPLQEGILFHHLVARDSDPYLIWTLMSFGNRGRLDDYVEALNAVIARHDILRTAIVWAGLQDPVQVVWRRAHLVVEEIAIDARDGDVAEQLKTRYCQNAYHMELDAAPLMKFFIAQDLPRQRWVGLWLLHHLIDDSTSIALITTEIGVYLAGRGHTLSRPPQFRDFVAKVRANENTDDQEQFFREMLAEFEEPSAPFGVMDVVGSESRTADAFWTLPVELSNRIRACARTFGVSAASLFHVAWAQVVGCTSGRDDVVFGTVLFGRTFSNVGMDYVGPLVNTLPFRLRFGGATVRDCVLKTHRLLGELLRHENAPLSVAQRCSALPAQLPLFTALLNYRHRVVSSHEGSSDSWDGINVLAGDVRSNYPIALSVDDIINDFTLRIQVNTAIDPNRICTMVGRCMQELVDALEFAPNRPLSVVDALPPDERRRILIEWNPAERSTPQLHCIHHLFEKQAVSVASAVAVVCASHTLTYAELNAQANQFARYLRSQGVGPEVRVAICLERSVEMVLALLGVLKAGGAYVPLDPEYPAQRLNYLLTDSRPDLVVTDQQERATLSLDALSIPVVDIVLDRECWSERSTENLSANELQLRPNNLAYVIYTSGSTGEPKGVMVEHQNVVRLFGATTQLFNFGANDVWTLFHSLAFDFSVWEMFGALLHGGRLVIVSKEATRNPDEFYELVCIEGVTILNQTPSAFANFQEAHARSRSMHSLRHIVFGGEALDVSSLKSWYERHEEGGGPLLVNMYGITETTVHATYRPLSIVDTGRGRRTSPIGRRLKDLSVYILNKHGKPAPIGVSGEIYIGGAGVARGYLNRPELTSERFIDDPYSFVHGAKMYRTGDVGIWNDDGTIEYVGRYDAQVKVRGYRVELGEIENVLLEHSLVAEAAVLLVEDGLGQKRLVAYYTAEGIEESQNAAAELRAHLEKALPSYMVPTAYVRIAMFPLTINGKVDRMNLPSPDERSIALVEYRGPVNPLQVALCKIWSQVLDLPNVGIGDSFFAIGGDSILSLRVLALAHRASIPFDVADLFRYKTIEELSNAIAARESTNRSSKPSAEFELVTSKERTELAFLDSEIVDAYPLSQLQQGMYFHSELDPRSAVYHDVSTLRVELGFHEQCFKQALEGVVKQHAILRTAFHMSHEQRLLQVVRKRFAAKVEVIDASVGGLAEQEDAIGACIEREKREPFVWTEPPWRLYVHILGPKCFQLTLGFHHALLDGWSLVSFDSELLGDYAILLDGRDTARKKPTALFRDYIALEQRALLSEQTKEYWCELLEGANFGSTMGTTSVEAQEVSQHRVLLHAGLNRKLHACARELDVGVRALLLAAHVKVMSFLFVQRDIVTGVVSHGRLEEEGGDRCLGLHLNSLPLRVKLEKESWRDLIFKVRTAEEDMWPHRRYPLAAIGRLIGRRQLFTTLFTYLRFHVIRQTSETIRVSQSELFEQTNFDLTVNFIQDPHSIALTLLLTFKPSAYSVENIQLAAGYYLSALATMVADLTQTHDAKSLMSDEERQQVIYSWNRTYSALPAQRDFRELFEEQVQRTPNAIAAELNESTLTFSELNAHANQLAHHLSRCGVKADSRVALCLDRSLEMLVGVLGVLKAGGAYVPMDSGLPDTRLAFMLADCSPVVMLTTLGARHSLAAPEGCMVLQLDLLTWALGAFGMESMEDLVEANRSGLTSRAAYVIYTSGSTGTPKGVVVDQGSIVNLWHALKPVFGELCDCRRVALNSSFVFDASIQQFVQMLSGRTVVIVPEEARRDASLLLTFVKTRKIDAIDCTPSQLRVWISAGLLDDGVVRPRLVLVGGEAIESELWDRLKGCKGIQFHNVYGPTECTVNATVAVINAHSNIATIGRPIANVRVYILDEYCEPVPTGAIGEIHIGGAGVARGYLNRAELTAKSFIADPFVAGERLYKTGDLGRFMPNGEIQYLGRNDFQVKIRGFRIEPAEIEARLVDHPMVREAVVLANKAPSGETQLVAYFTTGLPGLLQAATLREHLSGLLPTYMIPAAYLQLSALPLTASGKVDRIALPAPTTDSYGPKRYEPPLGAIESVLAKIFEDVLGLERVGRHDNFFDLGGHSLLAVRVLEQMRRHGLYSDVSALFTSPTLLGLSAQVSLSANAFAVPPNLIPPGCNQINPEHLTLVQLTQEEIKRIVATVVGGANNVQDIYPLAPLQEGILFHHLMVRNGDPYLVWSLLRFADRKRLDDYVGALNAMISRHDILRTAVVWEGLRDPLQVVWRNAPLVVKEVVLDPAEGDIAEQLAAQYGPRRVRIDVRSAPLVHLFAAYDSVQSDWAVMELTHHLLTDHIAWEELQADIQSELLLDLGRRLEPVPFRNFLAQLAANNAQHFSFFRQMLSRIKVPTVPFGILDLRGDGTRIGQASKDVEPLLAKRLRQLARGFQVGAATLIHIAWARVLAKTSESCNPVFGTVLFGRMRGGKEAHRALGLFMNTLPVCVRIDAVPAATCVFETHQTLAMLLQHENASLAVAQRCSPLPSAVPLFTSVLNYRHSPPESSFDQNAARAWSGIRRIYREERTNYPVALFVDSVGEEFRLTAQTTESVDASLVCDLMHAALVDLASELESSELQTYSDWAKSLNLPQPFTKELASPVLEADSEENLAVKIPSPQFEPPTGDVEIRLASIWAEALHVDRVGRHDNFFDLGGNSLLAVRLIERMRLDGLIMDLPAIFRRPTVALSALEIDQRC